MSYIIYKPEVYKATDLLKKFDKKKFKKLNEEEAMLHALSFYSDFYSNKFGNYLESLAFNCHHFEKKWHDTGKKIIFLSESFVDSILRSKVLNSISNDFNIIDNLPFDNFILSVPRHYKINVSIKDINPSSIDERTRLALQDVLSKIKHIEIDSYLISIGSHQESVKSLKELAKKIKPFDHVQHKESIETDRKLSYQFNADNAICLHTLSNDELINLVNSNDYYEYMQERKGKKFDNASSLEFSEFIRSYYALKIITGLALFNAATQKKLIRKGLPSEIKQLPLPAQQRTREVYTFDINNKMTNRSAHFRKLHYRTLIDERYYRNQYKDMKKGSRIVLVNPSIVGLRTEKAYTVD